MTTEKYKQVADLIEGAFKNLRTAARAESKGAPDYAAAVRTHAALQVHAAQAVATLALASEVRAVGLLLTASMGDVRAAPELVRDAFTAAAIHLDLVEPAEDERLEDLARMTREETRADDLYAAGQDPADDEGDLK